MREIHLSKGQVAIIDDCDFDLVAGIKWYALKKKYQSRTDWYAVATKLNGSTSSLRMHRLITNAVAGQMVDHKNGNGLDNRRPNLRICTCSQNNQNRRRLSTKSSQFKGVRWHKQTSRWESRIMLNKVSIYLGCFTNEHDAAIAYDAAARNYFGEFALTNF